VLTETKIRIDNITAKNNLKCSTETKGFGYEIMEAAK
jgi:hypothetical protein